jgi:hypothetical protein
MFKTVRPVPCTTLGLSSYYHCSVNRQIPNIAERREESFDFGWLLATQTRKIPH